MPIPWELAVMAAAALVLIGLAVLVLVRLRVSPEGREMRRRLVVSRTGRLVDGMIVEATRDSLYYTYAVAGVAYSASQDISRLAQYLPDDPSRLIGPVWLKYVVRNPANSIVISERWSGIRTIKEMQTQ